MSAALSVIPTTLFAHSNLLLSFPHLPNSCCYYIANKQHICCYFVAPPAPRRRTFSAHCFVASENSTPTTTATSRKVPISVYLMEKLSFSEKEALTASEKLLRRREDPRAKQVTDLIYTHKADEVISFFQGYCQIHQSHIIKQIVAKYPKVLAARVVDKTLKPKIKLLQDLGFSTSDLALVLSRNPDFYLQRDLTPVIQALRGIMGSDEYVVKLLKRVTYLSTTQVNYIFPNVDMLENEYGIPRDKLRKFLASTPKALMRTTDWLRDVLVRVEDKLGISRDSTVFMRAVDVLSGLTNEKIESKCQVFRSYGWSESDILSLIRVNPKGLGYSEARLKKHLEYFMIELGWFPNYLMSRPAVFDYSLENRVVPRRRILLILKEKGLVKADYKLYNALSLTDERFFDRFILPYQNDVPELRELYVNGCTPGLPADN